MEAVAEQAENLAEQLRSLQSAIDELIPLYRSDVLKSLELPIEIEWASQKLKLKLERTPSFLAQKFESVSNKAGWYAPMFRDKGGKPSMVEFRALLQGLGHAFERATGREAKVTADATAADDSPKYGGDFLELLKTILPLTLETARRFGWQMSHPQSSNALGKYVEKFTSPTIDATRASNSAPPPPNFLDPRANHCRILG